MKTTGMSTGGALAAAVERLSSDIGRFFSAMAEGARASREYERPSGASDAALEREGLTRDQVSRAVMERHFR